MATPMTPSQLLAVLKAEGLTVREYPGWRDRCRCHTGSHEKNVGWLGNTASRGWGSINGTVTHITAGNLGSRTVEQYIRDIINGDPAVPCKAQFVVAPGGEVWLNSAGRCNHAGKVGADVRAHLVAADFSTTDDYDSRWRGAADDGNAFTLGIENIAATRMTDDGDEDFIPDDQYDASVMINAAIARHLGWTGQESVGHGEISGARTKSDPNLDMGKFRRDVMARVKAGPGKTPAPKPPVTAPSPKPTPVPKPTPKPRPVSAVKDEWTLTEWNIAGMNALGRATVKLRNPHIVDAISKSGGDVIAINELANPNVNAFTALMSGKGFKRLPGGSDGRYIFVRNAVKVGKSGVFDLHPRYKGDDKQAAWGKVWVGGTWKLIVVPHLEYRKAANNERVGQAKSMIVQARAKAKELGILWENIIFAGDVNSDSWVTVKALNPSGFVDVFSVARAGRNVSRRTFTGWSGILRNGPHIDVVGSHKDGPKVLLADIHVGSRTTLNWMASDHLMTIVKFQG